MKTDSDNLPVLSVDLALFRIAEGTLQTLLHRRRNDPFKGALALPGALVLSNETLLETARRVLKEKIGWPHEAIDAVHLEQLAAFDALYRDVRGRTVSMAHLGIVCDTPSAFPDVVWKNVQSLSAGSLPFDHNDIIDLAVRRIRGKLRYTNIAREFLKPHFRIDELQAVYEAFLKKKLNRANFRMKLTKIGLIKPVRKLSEAVGSRGGRPPLLYTFVSDRIDIIGKDFL